MLSRIRKEAMERSQIEDHAHVYGRLCPRLTGSPNHKAAAEWAVKQMTAWGLECAPRTVGLQASRLAERTFDRASDLAGQRSARLRGARVDSEHERNSQAKAYQLVLPERPSQEQLTIFSTTTKQKCAAKIVLIGKPASIPVNLNPRQSGAPMNRYNRFMDQCTSVVFPTPSPTPTPAPNAPRR